MASCGEDRRNVTTAASGTADTHPREVVYDGPGVFGGRSERVLCESTPSGFLVSVSQRAQFFVSADGDEIRRLNISEPGLEEAVLLGPVMTLALALQGLFTLHASAVAVDGVGVCFLGESGAGKSTAAEYVAESRSRVRRVADDMAPFQVDEGLRLLAGMPQAKMPAQGLDESAMGSFRVTRLVWLDPVETAAGPGGLRRLNQGEITRRLAGSTIGTRLFDAALLRCHFSFCSMASREVTAFLSTLPRTRGTLRELSALLSLEGRAPCAVAGEGTKLGKAPVAEEPEAEDETLTPGSLVNSLC